MVREPVRDLLDVASRVVEAIQYLQRRLGVPLRERFPEIEVGVQAHEPERLRHRGGGHPFGRERERLVQPPQRVPHAAFGRAGDEAGGVFLERDLLLGRDVEQVLHQLLAPETSELEDLAARGDGVGNVERLGRAEDEPHVGGGLLQRFQEGVPRKVGELVRLVDDVDLESPARGRVLHVLAEIADLLDAPVRRAVDLEHVERGARRDLEAAPALVAGLGLTGLPALAVQGLRDEARRGGLAAPARAGEEVGVGDPVLGHRLLQRGADWILADQVSEALGPVLPSEG